MRLLLRAVLVVAAASVLLAGTVTGVVALAHGLAAGATSSQPLPLPALGTTAEEGSTVYAADGTTVLAVLRGPEVRKPIALSQVSPVLKKAVLDTEDAKFYIHGGIDVTSALRALASDSASGGGLQGGSTITQQLVKQVYLTPQRKISRKIKEAVLAERLQQKYTKDQILQAYLNIIYLGNSAYGVEAAANEYFNQPASAVTLPEAALLAGLIQDPNGYDPIANPTAARQRRSEVLARMVHYHDISPAQAAAANAAPLPTTVTKPVTANNPVSDYYVRQVENQLLGSGSPLGDTYDQRKQALFEGGLKIVTDLDPHLQDLATQTVAADTPKNPGGFEQAMVTIDPATGKVRDMVGGTNFASDQYNVITQGSRQPGSGFKLFTLLAALDQGYSPFDTINSTAPCAIDFPRDHDLLTHPATNDEGPGTGGVQTLVDATAQSLNCGFLRLAHETTLPAVAAMARKLGITTPLSPYFPSMVLGADPVHPLELAAAYAAVADGGIYHRPTFIDHIVDRTGSVIYNGVDPGHRVVSAQVAAEATVALNAVVANGTGTAAGLYNRQVAGKTGTTSSFTDAWFNGFVPQLETTVWMGSPTSTKSVYIDGQGVYGGTYPAHTWHDFMAAALADVPAVPFAQPDPSLIPPSKYINSASLARDDHSGGIRYGPNGQFYGPGPNSPGASYNYGGYSGGSATGGGSTPAATSPPAPAATVAPATTVAPAPKKGKHG